MKRILIIAGAFFAISAGAQPLAGLDERWRSGFIDRAAFTAALIENPVDS